MMLHDDNAPTLEDRLACWLDTANAHDVEAHLALYVDDGRLVFCFDGSIVPSWQALLELQKAWWRNGESRAVYAPMQAARIDRIGDDVALIATMISASDSAPDGSSKCFEIAVTMVWQRLPEAGWKIVQTHESSRRLPAG